jgi:ribosomal protein S1
VPVGTTAAFEILSIDPEKKRIGLSLVEEGSARNDDLRDDVTRQAEVPVEGFGSLADKLRGVFNKDK